MAQLRTERDSERQLVLSKLQAWTATAAADSTLLAYYVATFAPKADAYRDALATHRTSQAAYDGKRLAVQSADETSDEAMVKLELDLELNQGGEGLRKLKLLLANHSRSQVCGLSVARQNQLIGDMLARIDGGFDLGATPARLDAVRAAYAAVGAALADESAARTTRGNDLDSLDDTRQDFDKGWGNFCRGASDLPEFGSAGLGIDLAAYRRNRKSEDSEPPEVVG